MNMIPVFLNLKGKNILIIGGGTVALRKANYFDGSEAKLTIIAPEFVPELSHKKNCHLIVREACDSDIKPDYSLVILATNLPELNKRLAGIAEELGILFNSVDQTLDNRFITCSRIDQHPIHIGINSSGAPSISQIVKTKIVTSIDQNLIDFAILAIEVRKRLKETALNENERKAFMKNFFSVNKLTEIEKEGLKKLREEIDSCLSC